MSCKVFCPKCKNELTENGKLISDDEKGVLYKCSKCGHYSLWDFDAPVPLLLYDSKDVIHPINLEGIK